MRTEMWTCDYFFCPTTTSSSDSLDGDRHYELRQLVPGSLLYPYVQRLFFGASGRGITTDTLTYHHTDGTLTSTVRLIFLDLVRRDPVTGSPIAHRDVFSPTRRDAVTVVGDQDHLKTTCLDYDDVEGRVVVGTSNGDLRIIQF